MNNLNVPKYVSVNGIALRLINDVEYYRDSGEWRMNFREENGKIYSYSPMYRSHLHNLEMTPITKQQYINDNYGYI